MAAARYVVTVLCFMSFVVAISTLCCDSGLSNLFAGELDSSQLSEKEASNTLKVLWTASSYHLHEGSQLNETEAKEYLFQPLYIGKNSITFMGKSCSDVTFKRRQADSELYIHQKFQIKLETIKYSHSLLNVVTTDCELEGFSEYLHLRDQRIVLPIKGALIVFEPLRNY